MSSEPVEFGDENQRIKNRGCISNLLQQLRADKGQHVLQKFEEGRLQQNPFKGLENGGDQPGIRIVFYLLLFAFFLCLSILFFHSHFPLKMGKIVLSTRYKVVKENAVKLLTIMSTS